MRKCMTGIELWNLFAKENNIDKNNCEAWAFGVEADVLANLVVTGEKTATASAYPLYGVEDEPLPSAGEYSVILDSKDNAVCVIQTTKVYVIPFNEVTEEQAFKEGEGDKSLEYWRKVHKKFFTECMEEAGLKFSSDMKVVCEEFVVVYKA